MERGNRTTWQKEPGTCSEKKRGRLIIRPLYQFGWLRGLDLNQRAPGYEPDELPGCSTPRKHHSECVEAGQINGRQAARVTRSCKQFRQTEKFSGRRNSRHKVRRRLDPGSAMCRS